MLARQVADKPRAMADASGLMSAPGYFAGFREKGWREAGADCANRAVPPSRIRNPSGLVGSFGAWSARVATAFLRYRQSKSAQEEGPAMPSEKHRVEAWKAKPSEYFALERAGSVLVVVLGQSLDSLCGSELLEERSILLDEIREPTIGAVVIDFANVEYFDSLVLDTLCQVWKHLREREGKMALCNLSEVGDQILRTSRLDTLWHLRPSRLSALESLGLKESAISLR